MSLLWSRQIQTKQVCSASICSLSRCLGRQSWLFYLQQVRRKVRKVILCSLQLQRPTTYAAVYTVCRAGLVTGFQLRTSGYSRPNRQAMTKGNITTMCTVVRFAVPKGLFSNPPVGNWPMSASTRSQSHYFALSMKRPGLAQPGREMKTGPVMTRWKVFTCVSSCSQHNIRRWMMAA